MVSPPVLLDLDSTHVVELLAIIVWAVYQKRGNLNYL
jgi:hypothetical protein